MSRRCLVLVAGLAVSILTPAVPAWAAEPAVKIGDKVERLRFKDIRYLSRSLDDFGKKKAYVLVFTTASCPVAARYLPTLTRLEKEYRGKGVQFVAVNVGPDDSVVAMAAQAVKYDVPFPFVKDFAGKCAPAVGVKRTPGVALLDADRRLRYRGRIDDQYRVSGARAKATRNDLKEAIDAVLAGREVAVKETEVDGCLITAPRLRPREGAVTFAEHIAPLVKKHCQECHRPGASAPFSLVTYEQVSAKAATVAEVVAEQRMPPWYADPEHGTFSNRRGLTAEERDLFRHWIKAGKPLGDKSKLPKPLPALAGEAWRIGKPDLIVRDLVSHKIPKEGLVPYRYVVLPKLFGEDTWVEGIEIKPDNPKVVHHCNMAYITTKEGFKASHFITGTVPGGEPMTLPEGVAFRIPKGAMLGLQIHFVTNGKPERCRVSVGLRYARGKVQKQLHHILLEDHQFAIPSGAPAHKVEAATVLNEDVIGLGLFCHMHLRGRDMTFTARYPKGKRETLLLVPNYSFDWQMPYRWETGKRRLPKGTRLECVAHYDNSSFNPFNPDPKATVRDGQQTHEEMMNGFFFYTSAKERLNLEIDPKTGRVAKELKKKG
jgi:peroxiredoxin